MPHIIYLHGALTTFVAGVVATVICCLNATLIGLTLSG